MNTNNIFAFDIGISSIGWSVRDLTNNYIVDLGVRLFPVPEHPKKKITNASIRSEQKRLRKSTKRRKARKEEVKRLLVDYNILSKAELNNLYNANGCGEDIYNLRAEALDRTLTNVELGRLLLFFIKRRGYKSNSKQDTISETNSSLAENLDDDTKIILSSISKNRELMNAGNYRTVGEMLIKSDAFKDKKKNGVGKYVASFHRDDLLFEIELILKTQKELGFNLSDEFIASYIELFSHQNPYSTKANMEKLIGDCSLIKNEKRAAKNTYSFERFIFLSKLNNLKVNDESLSPENKSTIKDLAFTKKTIKYKDLRKALKLNSTDKFNLINYDSYDSIEEAENNVFFESKGYYAIKSSISKVSKDKWESIKENYDLIDKIAYEISVCKFKNEFDENLKDLLEKEFIDELFNIDFTSFGNISLKAVKKLLPHLESGYNYYDSCILSGLNPKGYIADNPKHYKLPVFNDNSVSNTRIIRVVSEFRKVYNNLVDQYGPPSEVNIEVSRQLSISKKRSSLLNKVQVQNKKNNEALISDFNKLFGRDPSETEKIKYKLWLAQNKQCMYSGNTITESQLLDDSVLEIDHVIHISLSGDDSLNNKVLVFSIENQQKGAQTPYEYFGNDVNKWSSFENRVNNSNFPTKKKNILLKKYDFTDHLKGFRERHLTDTQYSSILIYNYIKNNAIGAGDKELKVRCISGSATSFLRKIWDFGPKDRDGHYHHITDSLLIGACDEAFIQRISYLSKQDILNKVKTNPSAKAIEYYPMPYPHFKEEVFARLSETPRHDITQLSNKYNLNNIYTDDFLAKVNVIYPSVKVNRKLNGQIHPESIESFSNVKRKHNSFDIRGGTIKSAEILRTDFFSVKGVLKVVPVYRYQVLDDTLPNVIIKAKGIATVEDKDFEFSLYKEDSVLFKEFGGERTLAIYKGVDSSTGSVALNVFKDGAFTKVRIGLSKVEELIKVDVDVLGKVHIVKKQSRKPFDIKCLK